MEEKTSVVDTFEKLYPLFLDCKGKETLLANAHKLNWVWETYYKGESIVKRKFSEITVVMPNACWGSCCVENSDFSETLVHIQRQEIKHYDKLDNGEIIRNGYEDVPHGKTPNTERELF